jgi:serine/threonine-protein kinase
MSNAVDRLNLALEGRYRVEDTLGEGGMATVYAARDLRHERDVAIKVLKPELAAVIGGERFLAEIRTTANLQHPHILPLFDSGEADGFLYYVMPNVVGKSVREKVDSERQLGVGEAVGIARDVADALSYAHRNDVVHRDIKPENILLHDGNPVVADFGIALALSAAGGGRLTETGISLGTPHYMSPEQATADRDLTARSDVYSLACVLYEMLAGSPPHTGPTAQVVLMRILTEDPRPVTDVRKSVPVHVASVLAKALEKLPADRFEDAEAFRTALEDEGFAYRPKTRPEPAIRVMAAEEALSIGGRLVRWIRNPISMAAVGVALILAAWGWLSRPAEPDLLPVRLSLDLGQISPDASSDVIVSPDGAHVAVAGNLEGWRGLHIRKADEERFRAITDAENARYPSFSPDGNWIVFRDFSRDVLLKVTVDGGTPLTVLPSGVVQNPIFPHWGDDGTIVFSGPGGLYRIPDTGGGRPDVLRDDLGRAYFPRLLPGGSAVLFTDVNALSIAILDLNTDTVRTLVSDGVDATYLETGHLLYAHPNGGLFTVAFDLARLEVTGQPVPVLPEVEIWRTNRAHFAVSKNGTLVYGLGGLPAGGGEQLQLQVVGFDGGTATLPLAPRSFLDPKWSPDGTSVAYASGERGNAQIFTYSVELGTIPRQLTFEGNNDDPEWSPDGTRIAFSSFRAGTQYTDLFLKTLNDDAPAVGILTMKSPLELRHWPSDDVLVFENLERGGGSGSLWICSPTDPSSAQEYLVTEADLDDIRVSPDGDWAAYQSDETGSEEIYVRSFPVPKQQIAVTRNGGQFPRWSPDGQTIYYWDSEDSPIDTLFAASVQTEPTFIVLSREPVLSGDFYPESWDLHPDGDRIVVAQPFRASQVTADGSGPERERFLVVVNWFEELKERLGRGR